MVGHSGENKAYLHLQIFVLHLFCLIELFTKAHTTLTCAFCLEGTSNLS